MSYYMNLILFFISYKRYLAHIFMYTVHVV